ncbi:helix-turn-helix domain-containing protein [Glutamicibacter arilaitensis]|uniref:helix-turn-helix domain-containing protein n=1 Tax=Glutamicibacter TaxID=1742989 RepID=UPI003F91C3EE
MTAAPINRTPINRTAGLEVKAWLARRGMTQGHLAEALGVSQGAVSQRILGKVSFSIDELLIVSGLLNVTLGQLLGEEILNEKGPDPRNADRGQNELLQLDLNQQPFD